MVLHAPYPEIKVAFLLGKSVFGILDSYFKTKLKLGYQSPFWSPIFHCQVKKVINHLDPPPEQIGINFFPHIGTGVGIKIRKMDRNRNRSWNRALWNQSVTPKTL